MGLLKGEMIFLSQELLNKIDAMCRIEVLGGKIAGIGFILEINDANLPFKRGLLTANHVLDINKEIRLINKNRYKTIKITKNRRVFTDKELDYTFIEILPEDDINLFCKLIDLPNNDLQNLNEQEIFLLQFKKDSNIICLKQGVIVQATEEKIIHNCITEAGCFSGSLILLRNNSTVIGFNLFNDENKINFGIPILSIINDIKNKKLFIKSNDYKEEYNNL